MALFSKIKERLGLGAPVDDFEDSYEEEYVEIDTTRDIGHKSKIVVKSFVLSEFGDVKEALDAIREGYTIALINIKSLSFKDLILIKAIV